jgi:hypothetical protein
MLLPIGSIARSASGEKGDATKNIVMTLVQDGGSARSFMRALYPKKPPTSMPRTKRIDRRT